MASEPIVDRRSMLVVEGGVGNVEGGVRRMHADFGQAELLSMLVLVGSCRWEKMATEGWQAVSRMPNRAKAMAARNYSSE